MYLLSIQLFNHDHFLEKLICSALQVGTSLDHVIHAKSESTSFASRTEGFGFLLTGKMFSCMKCEEGIANMRV